MLGLPADCAATGIQPPQAAGRQLAGRGDRRRAASRKGSDGARCGPERRGESVREAPQQKAAPRTETGRSEDLHLGGSCREASPQTDRPRGTGIGRKPSRRCRTRADSHSSLRPLGSARSVQGTRRRARERLGARGCQGSSAPERGLSRAVTRDSVGCRVLRQLLWSRRHAIAVARRCATLDARPLALGGAHEAAGSACLD